MFDSFIDDFKLPKIREFDELISVPYDHGGVTDKDKTKYIYALDKTENPNLICPYQLRSGELFLDPGYYEVALSDDKRYLLLIQSRELKALVPAIKVVIQKGTTAYENRVEEINKAKKKKLKKYKHTNTLDKELASMRQLELNAKIYDSKKGYYIIEYRKFNTYAWGYVPY